MSGGSFNYIGMKAKYSETDQASISDIKEMAEALDALGEPAAQAAARTREILALFDQINELGRDLHEVWTDVEWWHSGDSGQETVMQALTRFNEAQAHPK